MNKTRTKMTDLLGLLVFAVFSLCMLALLLTGVKAYENMVHKGRESYDRRTAAQYLTTRVRQADRLGSVSLQRFGEQDALVFAEVTEAVTYETWVYYYDGYLRELFVAAGGDFMPEDGEKVLAAQDLSIRQNGQQLDVELTDPSGEVQTLNLYLRSGKGAAE